VFFGLHGSDFSKKELVIQKVVKLAKASKKYPSQIPEKVIQCLVRTRTYIRIKKMCKRMYEQKEQRKRNKKMKKIVGVLKPK